MLLRLTTYTCRNYAPRGQGFFRDAQGYTQLSTDPADYTDFSIRANIQPFSGERRKVDGPGSETTDRVKMYIAPTTPGVFPDIRAARNQDQVLPTRFEYKGDTYEVCLVKRDFEDGFIPHIYAEACLLVHEAEPTTDEDGIIW